MKFPTQDCYDIGKLSIVNITLVTLGLRKAQAVVSSFFS